MAAVGTRSTLREQVIGLFVALFVLTGRWSPARVFDLEPSVLYEPRVWATTGLALLAMLPAPRLAYSVAVVRGSVGVITWQLAYLGFALTSVAWAPDLDKAPDNATHAVLMLVALASLYRLCGTVDPQALVASIWRMFTGVLTAMAVMAIVGGIGSSRLAILGGGPNVFGRNMGLLCVIWLFNAIRGGSGWVLAVGSTVAAALVVLSGSRGAMVATAAALAFLLFVGRQGLSRRLLALGVFICLGLLVVGYTELARPSWRASTLAWSSCCSRRGMSATATGSSPPRSIWGVAVPSWVMGSGRSRASRPGPTRTTSSSMPSPRRARWGSSCSSARWARARGCCCEITLGRWPGAVALVLFFVSVQFSGGLYDLRGVYVFGLLATVLEPRAFLFQVKARSG